MQCPLLAAPNTQRLPGVRLLTRPIPILSPQLPLHGGPTKRFRQTKMLDISALKMIAADSVLHVAFPGWRTNEWEALSLFEPAPTPPPLPPTSTSSIPTSSIPTSTSSVATATKAKLQLAKM